MMASDTWFVWTDFGGVLTPPIEQSFSAFCSKYGIDPADMKWAMRKLADAHGVKDPLELLDRPILVESDWIAELNQYLDHELPLETLADDWFSDREKNLAWEQVLLNLRAAGTRVGMLSNMVPAWDEHWRRMVDPTTLFDRVMLSYEVGFRKPEPQLFEMAARFAGVEAERCILVDDLETNCAGAIRSGWRAVHFQDVGLAKEALLELISAETPEFLSTNSVKY